MNDDAVFKFDLQETLHFESGQEVAEMKGISLDPEISIQNYDDYISIRGVIELQGEYVKHESPAQTELEQDEDTHAKRFVERVMDTEDNEASFLHRFPVEISVPSYRVTRLDDVYVHIDEFDYHLPNPYQLNFTSTVSIYGIEDEENDETQTSQTSSSFVDAAEPEFDTNEFEFELREPLNDDSKDHNEDNEPDQEAEEQDQDAQTLDNEETKPHANTDIQESSPETEEEHEEASKTLGEYFEETAHSESEFNQETNHDYKDTAEHDSDVSSETPEVETDRGELVSHVEGSIESDPEDVQDVMYLANMFASEEETYSKMVLYIVQDEDSIETIAEKYDVKPERIMRHNHLSEDDVLSEGKLIYIPVKKQSH